MMVQQYADTERLTKEQAAIIGAYTGIAVGPFGDIQDYAEKKLGRPILTHEFANRSVWSDLRAAAKDDLLAICHQEAPSAGYDFQGEAHFDGQADG